MSLSRKPELLGPLDRIKAIERANEQTLIYWLLRGYRAAHKASWAEGETESEYWDTLIHVLANFGFDPSRPESDVLLKTGAPNGPYGQTKITDKETQS